MALPKILTRTNGTLKAAVEVPMLVTAPAISTDELLARINLLGQEVARLSREVASLRASNGAAQTSTVGPLPTSAAEIASGRSGMRFIAHATGRNEDTIRGILTRSSAFASLREKAPDLTTNVALMRWLAAPAKGTTELRFSLISGGFNTPEQLAREGRQ